MLTVILNRDNMQRAYKRVTTNKGAAGVDEVQTTEQWPRIKAEIAEGRYIPQPVCRVEIDKPGGGVRQLGIPTTTDRLIQQAIGQVIGRSMSRSSPLTAMDFVRAEVLMTGSNKR